MGGVGENGQAGSEVGAGNRTVHLTFVRSHFERRGDFAKGAPTLGGSICDQLLNQLILRHLGHADRIDGESDVFEVATRRYNPDLAAFRDRAQVAQLFWRPPSRRRIDDAAEAIEGTRPELFHREVYVGTAHVFVEEGRAIREVSRVEVSL